MNKEEMADAFGLNTDPLEQYHDGYEQLDDDPFEYWFKEVLEPRGTSEKTISHYRMHLAHYREFMRTHTDRHPACPNENHIAEYITHLHDDRDNSNKTIRGKLRTLNAVYEYWQADSHFPHPTDYNPIEIAKQKIDLSDGPEKKPPYLSMDQLTEEIQGVKHIRDRQIIVMQVKLGLRAGEVTNMRLEHLNLTDDTVANHYTDIGTHPEIEDYPNAVYIPSATEMDGNKSQQSRILPLDKETRYALRQYLLIRPDNGEPWVFLTAEQHRQLDSQDVSKIWHKYFRPKYDETDKHTAISSHYGRHHFSSYWRNKQNVAREYVKYMRGDVTSGGNLKEGIDHYLHAYYEEIEPIYRDGVYQLGLFDD